MLGFLVLAFSQFIGNAQKGQKNVQNAVDFDILKTNLNLVLNTSACNGAFSGSASGSDVVFTFPATIAPGTNILSGSSPVPIFEIKQGSTVVARINENMGGGMKITKLQFIDAIYDGDQNVGTPSVTYKAFVATLNVEAEKALNSMGTPGYSTNLGIRLLVLPTGATTGTIKKCAVSSSSPGEPMDPTRPWMKRYIVCRTASGGWSVLNFAGDSLSGLLSTIIYTSPHGSTPLGIRYNGITGAYVSHNGSSSNDAASCVGRSLQLIANDSENANAY